MYAAVNKRQSLQIVLNWPTNQETLMSYSLYGSQTSLFVRRIRMVMENIPFEFKEINIFDKEGAQELNKINPLNKIPVLKDGETVVWDSRQIFNYLNHKHKLYDLSTHEENLLTAIEGAMEAGVNLLLLRRSEIDISSDKMFIKRQHERIKSVLDYIQKDLNSPTFKKWNFVSMTLYAFIDWAIFREVIKAHEWEDYVNFLKNHSHEKATKLTEIPRT